MNNGGVEHELLKVIFLNCPRCILGKNFTDTTYKMFPEDLMQKIYNYVESISYGDTGKKEREYLKSYYKNRVIYHMIIIFDILCDRNLLRKEIIIKVPNGTLRQVTNKIVLSPNTPLFITNSILNNEEVRVYDVYEKSNHHEGKHFVNHVEYQLTESGYSVALKLLDQKNSNEQKDINKNLAKSAKWTKIFTFILAFVSLVGIFPDDNPLVKQSQAVFDFICYIIVFVFQ